MFVPFRQQYHFQTESLVVEFGAGRNGRNVRVRICTRTRTVTVYRFQSVTMNHSCDHGTGAHMLGSVADALRYGQSVTVYLCFDLLRALDRHTSSETCLKIRRGQTAAVWIHS